MNQKPNQYVEHILLKVTDVTSSSFVMKFIQHSLFNLQHVFFDKNSQALDKLTSILSNLSHDELIFVFFALLNVDILIKDYLCQIERPENVHKLIRFFWDIEKLFVQFLTNSEKSTNWMVMQCKHAYILA